MELTQVKKAMKQIYYIQHQSEKQIGAGGIIDWVKYESAKKICASSQQEAIKKFHIYAQEYLCAYIILDVLDYNPKTY